MIGILIIALLSWLLIWLVSRKHLTVLGITPSGVKMKDFFLGLMLAASLSSINLLGQAYFSDINYVRNTEYDVISALQGLYWSFRSALFEELLFRGIVLYFLIMRLGIIKACIISAVAFGIYHWFSYNMLGSGIVPMVYVFLLTGAGGWMFAFAFAKTKSLYAPLGLHFGWILASIVIFSDGPLGNTLFIPNGEKAPIGGWTQLYFFLYQTLLVPGIVTWAIVKRTAQSTHSRLHHQNTTS